MRTGISLPVRELGNDLGAIRAFAQTADEIGYTHLRVPRPGAPARQRRLARTMMLLAYVAAITEQIELVPSIIVTPSRQTVLLAKQQPNSTADGRPSAAGHRRRRQCRRVRRDERRLPHPGRPQRRTDRADEGALDARVGRFPGPLGPGSGRRACPAARAATHPAMDRRRRRAGTAHPHSHRPARGRLVRALLTGRISRDQGGYSHRRADAGRDPASIGMEAGVAVVGPREAEWQSRVRAGAHPA